MRQPEVGRAGVEAARQEAVLVGREDGKLLRRAQRGRDLRREIMPAVLASLQQGYGVGRAQWRPAERIVLADRLVSDQRQALVLVRIATADVDLQDRDRLVAD